MPSLATVLFTTYTYIDAKEFKKFPFFKKIF